MFVRTVPVYLTCVFDAEWGSRIQLVSWMVFSLTLALSRSETGRVVAGPMLLEPQHGLFGRGGWLAERWDLCEHGSEYGCSVLSTDQGVAGPFRVRHHAEDVAGSIHDPGDVVHRAVRVPFGSDFAGRS